MLLTACRTCRHRRSPPCPSQSSIGLFAKRPTVACQNTSSGNTLRAVIPYQLCYRHQRPDRLRQLQAEQSESSSPALEDAREVFSQAQEEQPANAVAESEGEAAPSQLLLAEQAVQPSGMNQTGATMQTVRTLQSLATDAEDPTQPASADAGMQLATDLWLISRA